MITLQASATMVEVFGPRVGGALGSYNDCLYAVVTPDFLMYWGKMSFKKEEPFSPLARAVKPAVASVGHAFWFPHQM